jgi:hypothetical protein
MNWDLSFHISHAMASPLPSQGRGQGEGSSAIVAGTAIPLTSILSPSARGEADRTNPLSSPA